MIALGQMDCSPQTQESRLERHLIMIEEAHKRGSEGIFFPELSLTGYVTSDVTKVAMNADDPRIIRLQKLSNQYGITIGGGLPLVHKKGITISMVILKPKEQPTFHHKNQLHSDEQPYFTPGPQPDIIPFHGEKMGIGICYESTQESHFKYLVEKGMTLFIASSAKTKTGMRDAIATYKTLAKKYSTPILAVNSIGLQDGFMGSGMSCMIDKSGRSISPVKGNKACMMAVDLEKESIVS